MNQVVESPQGQHQHLFKLLNCLLYYNLGGEMMYILNQRLTAQNVNSTKSSQILSDILNGLVSNRPRSVHFKKVTSYDDVTLSRMKIVFQDVLESSSSMRLTPVSFDKLFDLMAGVFKYQLVLCPLPSSLYHVTINHLNSIRDMSKHLDESITNRLTGYCNSFTATFNSLCEQQWFLLRSILLTNVFASIRTRISVLLKDGLQDMESGSYTISPRDEDCISQIHYDKDGNISKEIAPHKDYICDATNLGLDIYCRESLTNSCDSVHGAFGKLKINEAKETKLLACLLGRSKDTFEEASSVFLDLSFSNEITDTHSHELEEAGNQLPQQIACNNQEIKFEATERIQPAGLDEDESEFAKAATDSSDDLLALMDS